MTAPTDFDAARQHFLDGLAQLQAGQFDAAAVAFEASLARLPGRVSTLVNLAAVRNRQGRHAQALPLLAQALAAAPDDADAWVQRASAELALQQLPQALQSLQQLLALKPDLDWAWINRAHVLKDLGRLDEAAAAYREALQHGGDAELIGYCLAGLTGGRAPAAPPRAYVQRLFDSYADGFEAHLLNALGYRAHEVLLDLLRDAAPGPYAHALDLGCGTGLCGPLLRTLASRVDGVDLSAAMLAQARQRGVYDRLAQAELVEHLQHTPERFDLVLAADVFIYVGALQPVFAGVRRVLHDGGTFAFSVERAHDAAADFELRPSLRYAHGEHALRALAQVHGFEVVRVHAAPIREEQRCPIAGLYWVLRRG